MRACWRVIKYAPALHHLEEKRQRAEVAVVDQQIPCVDARQKLGQKRSFLSMAVFAGNKVVDHHILRVQQRQRMTRQSAGGRTTQHSQPMLASAQVIAVQDSHPVALQQWGAAAVRIVDQHAGLLRRVLYQRPGGAWFDFAELVVDGPDRHGNLLLFPDIGRMDRFAGTADHQTHHLDERGEEQLARVLLDRRAVEHRVQLCGCKDILHHRAVHYTHGTGVQESLKGLAEQHPVCPPWNRP